MPGVFFFGCFGRHNALHRLVPEKRYLTFCMWEEIAAELHYSVRTVQRLHVKALEEVQGILDEWE